MLFWLGEKICDGIDKYKRDQYKEEQAQKRERAFPVINALCHAELQRFSKNPVIDTIYNSLFRDKPPVTKITVSCTCVEAFYNNGTSNRIFFSELGLANLSYENSTIFLNNPIVHEPHWSGGVDSDVIDKYPYLYFCQRPTQFNECRAVGYLLAEKSGLPYDKPDSPINSISFVFPTNEIVLKSW